MNNDWPHDWIFYDDRFDIFHGPDERFLRFLCEMIHPVVRSNAEEPAALVEQFNQHLARDGWQMIETTRISGKPVYAARPLITGNANPVKAAKEVAFTLDGAYVSQQITRMESAINTDPELAIGTAKEFLETVCKTILSEREIQYDKSEKLPKLVKLTIKELQLMPDDLPTTSPGTQIVRILLLNLASVGHHLAELRNPYGTGHGKEAKHVGLQPRHARLAVGSASTLGVFLFECHQKMK